MINEFISIIELIQKDFGNIERDECLEIVGDEINVKPHSLKTNYLTKRAYNNWKLPRAIIKANEVYERFKGEKTSNTETKKESDKLVHE